MTDTMTDEQINERIAVRLCGWTKIKGGPVWPSWQRKDAFGDGYSDWASNCAVPRDYLNDGNAMLDLLGALWRAGLCAHPNIGIDDSGVMHYGCEIESRAGMVGESIDQPSMPRAVALAAIKVIEAEAPE